MPNCVVKGCINQTTRDKKEYGITYHTFPNRNQKIKEKWIEVIRDSRKEPSWEPTSRSVVCSAHFDIDDLYYTKKGLRRVVKNAYPKQEEPAAPDPSNDLNLSQPSSSCAQEEPSVPDLSNNINLSQHSSSCAIQAVQSDLSIIDTPKQQKLRQRLLLLEKTQEINKKKIKTLNQKVRRLRKRNESLNKILHNLMKQNYIDTDLFNLFNPLNDNMSAGDMFNALNRKS